MDVAIPHDRLVAGLLERVEGALPDLDPEALRTGLTIAEFAVGALSALETHFARLGLSQARYSTLMLLYYFPERAWTPSGLAGALRVQPPTMTGIVQVLEREGWVTRRRDDDDRRRSLLTLTPSGERRFAELLPRHFERFVAAFEGADPDELARFRDAIEGMRRVMRALADPPESV